MRHLVIVFLFLTNCKTTTGSQLQGENTTARVRGTYTPIVWLSDDTKEVVTGKCPSDSTSIDRNCANLVVEDSPIPLDAFVVRWKEAALFLRNPQLTRLSNESKELTTYTKQFDDLRSTFNQKLRSRVDERSYDELAKELVAMELKIKTIQLDLNLNASDVIDLESILDRFKLGETLKGTENSLAVKAALLAFEPVFLWDQKPLRGMICSLPQTSLSTDFGFVYVSANEVEANLDWRYRSKPGLSKMTTKSRIDKANDICDGFKFSQSDNRGLYDGWSDLKWCPKENFASITIAQAFETTLGKGSFRSIACRSIVSDRPVISVTEYPLLDSRTTRLVYQFLLREGKITRPVFDNGDFYLEGATSCSIDSKDGQFKKLNCSSPAFFAVADTGYLPSMSEHSAEYGKLHFRCRKSRMGTSATIECSVSLK